MKTLRRGRLPGVGSVRPGILLVILLVSASTATSQSGEPFSSPHFEIHQLGDGVFAAVHSFGGYAICNAGFVDLGDRTVVFDTFLSPEAARDLKRAAEHYTSRDISLVVNSHAHNDHIRGNQVFLPGAEIISTGQVRETILAQEPGDIAYEKSVVPGRLKALAAQLDTARGEEARTELRMWVGYHEAMERSFGELVTTAPTLTFDSVLILHGTRRSAKLISPGRAHTTSDVVLYLPAERILFTGDLVFNRMHPWLADGDPDRWRDVLGSLKSLDPATVVPGHGLPGDAGILDSMIVYISVVDDLAKTMAGSGMAEVTTAGVPARFREWSFPRFYTPNLRFMVKRAAGVPD